MWAGNMTQQVEAFDTKPDGTYVVEGEKQLQKAVLWPTYVHCGVCEHICTHKYNFFMKMLSLVALGKGEL